VTLRVLSLFSGIGGIDLGLERAGMRVVAQCEIEPFARAVLAKHWPDVRRYEDVRTLDGTEWRGTVDLVAGGFPCQDISTAGKGKGIEKGERSGLWREMRRIIGECRPRWVLAENVPALRTRGADIVLACASHPRDPCLSRGRSSRLDPRIRIHGWTVIAPPRVFLSLGVHTPGLMRSHDA